MAIKQISVNITIEPSHDNKSVFVPSEDSDQRRHLPGMFSLPCEING